MTKKITKAQALAALEEVVSGHEDYVYEYPEEILAQYGGGGGDCAYSTRDGQPSCIVGHVYAKLTPELFERAHEYEWANWQEEGDAISAFAAGDLFDNDYYQEDALGVLRRAQMDQDNGLKWGDALEAVKHA